MLEAIKNKRQQLHQYGVNTLANLTRTDRAIDIKDILMKHKSDGSIKRY
jgi:hypothetical protein